MAMQTDDPTPEAPREPEPEQLQNPLTLVLTLKSKQHAEGLRQQLLAGEITTMVAAVLDRLKLVHFARFVILDGDPPKLAVITSYDGDFDDYIREFVKRENLGDVFDRILAVVADPPNTPVSDHADEFVEYIRAHDLRSVGTFYSAYPTKEVGDILRADAPG